jgi:hypothetical protein
VARGSWGVGVRFPKGFTFRVGRPQQLAAVLLVVFLVECCVVISKQQLTSSDYRYARCGREMWERPSPLAGYFTTCGNLNGEQTFAYRLAGFPLTAQRMVLLASDWFRKPADKLYSGTSLNGSTWEARHEIGAVKWLMHLPFVFMAMWLGGGVWWVSRRLFGNEGGFFSLALYIFSPAVVRFSVVPNNEVLAMWGLYGLVYTAIGVAHAMQGPQRKWRPRIALLTLALGLTATAHLLAAMVGFVASVVLMFYLAERKRSAVLLIVTYAAIGAMLIELVAYSFRLTAFLYVFTGGAGRFWFSTEGVRTYAVDPANWPTLIAAAVALLLYGGVRRSRYFGNTAPLVMVLVVAFLETTQVRSSPWLWALPFLFTFLGGTFADALETKQRKLYLAMTGMVIVTQALVCWALLPGLAGG